MAVGIFIPAYNAADYLEEVLERIPGGFWSRVARVWIIDDGSQDETGRVARVLAGHYRQVEVVAFTANRGYGAVVKKGLTLCREAGVAMGACLHGDGQYAPEALPQMWHMIADREYDLVQGSRIASGTALSGGMPLYKFVANRSLTWLQNRIFRLGLTDYHSGYLCYSRKALGSLPFERLGSSFDIDVQIIASARAAGLRVGEIPVPTRYAREISHVHSIPYGLRILGIVTAYLCGYYHRRQGNA